MNEEANKKKEVRDRGNAAWCVRKHTGGALRHTTETNQKLGRNINNRTGRIKLDKPTKDEANAIIYDLDQVEYHIQSEVLPQVKRDSTKRKLRELDKKARKIRQNIAQTGVIFYDRNEVDEDTMRVMENSVKDLQKLIVDIDKTASHIMKQEQIECENCVEDLVGPEGVQALIDSRSPSKNKVSKPLFQFPKIDLNIFGPKKSKRQMGAEKAWKTRRKKYGKNGRR